MFTSGYLKLIKLQLIYIISFLQHGCLFSQIPIIASDVGVFETAIICSLSGLETVSVSFYEEDRLVVQIKTISGYCQHAPPNLPYNIRCFCLGVNASCTVSTGAYGDNCPRWKCAVPIKGVLHYSEFVNVCRFNCSADSTNLSMDTVRWVVGDIHYLKAGTLFPTEVYNTENISSLINSMEREENGSIIVCKVEEEDQLQWNIKILYPPALCSAYVSIHSSNQTCTLANGNPLIEVVRVDNESSKCLLGLKISRPEAFKLCDVVNRADLGAKYFVGNESGLFKLDILFRASVKEFALDKIYNQRNITFNVTSSITFKCLGHGNPPPEMTLVKDGVEYGRGYSLIKQTITLNGSQDCGNYTCIAANAFGDHSKTIQISCHIKIDVHQDLPQNATTIIQLNYIVLAGAGTLVLIVIIVAVVCVYRIYTRMKSIENVGLPMTNHLTTSTTTSPIPVIDQSVIYHEIDPLMIASDRSDVDDSTNNASQPSFNAGARQYEGLDRSRHADESQYLRVVAD